MTSYIIRRLLLMIPTLFIIMLINFAIIQTAPGGPVERMLAQIQGHSTQNSSSINTSAIDTVSHSSTTQYKGSQGVSPELIAKIEKLYGFDQPAYVRFFTMLKQYISFDFGESNYHGKPVITLIKERLPVSISLGLLSTLLIYFISIPLGIAKALRNGSFFDVSTSFVIIVGYATPAFLFAILLILFFASSSGLDVFPLRGLTSEDYASMSFIGKMLDRLWHIFLPTLAMVISGFATLTMLTKNSFLDEIGKQYVATARSKGLTERSILYKHVFRNAMLIIIAGFPAAFIGIFFTGALFIEYIFSLNGLGLLGLEAIDQRDYPVFLGTLYIFSLMGLILKLVSDLTYAWIDPRISFDTVAS